MKNPAKALVNRQILFLAAIAGAILFLFWDLVNDLLVTGPAEYGYLHLALETIVYIGVSIALVVGIRNVNLLRARLNRRDYKQRLLSRSLADAIDKRLDEWNFTRAEKQIAWLVIKGYRFSEIAELRGVKENTARLQATAIYDKAGVHGRAEFVAELVQMMIFPATATGTNR